jgi:lysophospholipid acyltransferase (LPLAT)-like uncharacterized protein
VARLRDRCVAFAAAWLLRGLGATWRVRVVGGGGLPAGRLRAGWHRHWLLGAGVYRGQGLVVAISRSRDGDRVAAALPHLGLADPPRGSSSRGGAALLLALVRRLRAGEVVALFPDGPRGPAEVAKVGVVSVARLSGEPITPIGAAARPALRLASWDRTLVPLPFARVVLAAGSPLWVARDASESEEARIAEEVSRELSRLNRAAAAALDSAR